MSHQPYLAYANDPQFIIGHATDAGRSGKNNEDLYAVFETQFTGDSTGFASSKVIVAVVADGIGGSVAGEMASDLAIQVVVASFRDTNKPVPLRLEEAIQRANREIFQQSISNPALTGMGTTLVGAIIGVDQFQVGHVGDSRAYLLRNGELHLLTLDHSWAQEAVEAGRLSLAEARVHTNRHVIKRFLGGGESVAVDYKMVDFRRGPLNPNAMPSWPRSERIDFLPGDSLLLCTDGLSDVVDEDRIKAILQRNSPQAAADGLIAEANKAGGPDNITVVIAHKAGDRALPGDARRPVLVGAGLLLLLSLLAMVGFFLLDGGAANSTQVAYLSGFQLARPTTGKENSSNSTATPTATASATPTTMPTATASATPTATSVATASATLTATPIATESAIPAATQMATTGAISPTAIAPTPTPTSKPKSTPVPPTPFPTTVSMPAPNALQRSTMPPTPIATPTPGNSPPRFVEIVSPGNEAVYNESDEIGFAWKPLPGPETNQYELVFWQENQGRSMEQGQAKDEARPETSRTIKASAIGSGRWCWGIFLFEEERRGGALTTGCRLVVIHASPPGEDQREDGDPNRVDEDGYGEK